MADGGEDVEGMLLELRRATESLCSELDRPSPLEAKSRADVSQVVKASTESEQLPVTKSEGRVCRAREQKRQNPDVISTERSGYNVSFKGVYGSRSHEEYEAAKERRESAVQISRQRASELLAEVGQLRVAAAKQDEAARDSESRYQEALQAWRGEAQMMADSERRCETHMTALDERLSHFQQQRHEADQLRRRRSLEIDEELREAKQAQSSVGAVSVELAQSQAQVESSDSELLEKLEAFENQLRSPLTSRAQVEASELLEEMGSFRISEGAFLKEVQDAVGARGTNGKLESETGKL